MLRNMTWAACGVQRERSLERNSETEERASVLLRIWAVLERTMGDC